VGENRPRFGFGVRISARPFRFTVMTSPCTSISDIDSKQARGWAKSPCDLVNEEFCRLRSAVRNRYKQTIETRNK
jgi:TPR repeat protein